MENLETQNLTKKQRRYLKRQAKLEKKQDEFKKKRRQSLIVWSLVFALVLATILGIFFLSNNDIVQYGDQLVDPVTEQDWIEGKKDAQVMLLEYSDFECPACARFSSLVNDVIEKYDEVSLAYRHFPLVYHKSSRLAARAAEAAGKQGQFFAMHDYLFTNQSEWTQSGQELDYFTKYADKLGLDNKQFIADYNSQSVQDDVEADYQSGLKNNIEATPSFYINGHKLIINNYGDLEAAIKKELSK